MKKAVLILAGIAVLGGGGYAAGQMLTRKDKGENFVQLEDGRRMRINGAESGEFNREGERPDVVGRIKSITDGQMVVEKFEMNGTGFGRGNNTAQEGEKPNMPAERHEPTVSGEQTIMLSDNTSYVKGPERGMGRRSGGSGSSNLEEISFDDLKENAMVSIWLSEDESSAQRVMVR